MTHRPARRPQTPAGSGVPASRAGGEHPWPPRARLSDLCAVGQHGRCRHPANQDAARSCDCVCHVEAAVA